MTSGALLSDSLSQSLQFKGEIMDFELSGIEVDHRKRRRNRTTQSCLNCHTSKRKCDRKRPCQRCIQLGLTGLCVYEVDDPSMRDDPNIDETTRLRKRIAELESLVRELRGKPHPKWAEPNFCDGDATEKWHSRSARRPQQQQQTSAYPQKGAREHHLDEDPHRAGRVLPMIKTEGPGAADAAAQAHAHGLYRFSPSPSPLSAVTGSPVSPYNTMYRAQHAPPAYSPAEDYSPPSSTSAGMYGDARRGSTLTASHDGHYYQDQYCPCVTNPAAGAALVGLTNQLQAALAVLRQLPEHASRPHCVILRRVLELNEIMHGNSGGSTTTGGYEGAGLSTPPETELSMSPISTSSQSSIGPSPALHEQWGALSHAGSYESYFPVPGVAEHAGVYKTAAAYHMH